MQKTPTSLLVRPIVYLPDYTSYTKKYSRKNYHVRQARFKIGMTNNAYHAHADQVMINTIHRANISIEKIYPQKLIDNSSAEKIKYKTIEW